MCVCVGGGGGGGRLAHSGVCVGDRAGQERQSVGEVSDTESFETTERERESVCVRVRERE